MLEEIAGIKKKAGQEKTLKGKEDGESTKTS
jgi:hypothetical protein